MIIAQFCDTFFCIFFKFPIATCKFFLSFRLQFYNTSYLHTRAMSLWIVPLCCYAQNTEKLAGQPGWRLVIWSSKTYKYTFSRAN